MKTAGKFGIVALIALAFFVLPRGGSALALAATLLGIGWLGLLGYAGYRLYRQYRFEIETLEARQRLVLYGSLGVALLTLAATGRLFDEGGVGVLVWLALLSLCSYGVFWVWTQYRRYS